MFLVAQRELAARNMFETIQQQHLAIRSFSWPDMTWPDMTWPDISGTWAGFMGWLAQPRELETCGLPAVLTLPSIPKADVVALETRQVSWPSS